MRDTQPLHAHCVLWQALARAVPGMQCTLQDVGLGRQLCAGSRHATTPGQPHTVECPPHPLLHTA